VTHSENANGYKLTVKKVHHGSHQEQRGHYIHKWREILEEFAKVHCRCENFLRGARCENYGISHVKGHQYNLPGDERVRRGVFKSTFPDAIDGLCRDLNSLLTPIFSGSGSYNWNRSIWEISKRAGIEKVISNRTCLTCLSRTPIHLLPCGHLICDKCAKSLGSASTEQVDVILVKRCPLGCSWNVDKFWIRKKPKDSGVRILSLDGSVIKTS
jgi:hypothetical protein